MFVIDEKPSLDDALLIHFGIRGMKWGVRRGRGTTGVSRTRGALIDQNNRTIMRIKEAQAGKGRLWNRLRIGVGRGLLGDARMKRVLNTKVSNLNKQNTRLKTGKAKALDLLQAGFTVSPITAVVSVRPK
jgi:hypothetical protein